MNRCMYVLVIAAWWCPDVVAAQGVAPENPVKSPLVVFHSPDDPGQVADVTDALRLGLAELASRRGGALLDLSPQPPAATRAAELSNRGIEAYRAFEYDTALEYLDAALTEVARTGGGGLSPSELSDLHIFRSLVLSQRGDSRHAWDELVAAATLDPTRKLDPVRFPPRVVESFERASVAVLQGSYSQFSIDSDPACQVWLDGHVATPNEPRAMPFGPHYVRVVCRGALPYGVRLPVQRAEERLRPALRRPELPMDPRLLELARERGADALIVAQVIASADAPTSASVRWLDLQTGRVREQLSSALPDAEAARAVSAATERLLGQRSPARVATTTSGDRPRASTPWHRRPWVWAAVGAATTALVLSPFLLDSTSPRGFTVRPTGDLPKP